ncbi:MAG: septum formation family protein [Candidatus Nanopelagicales bacterium]
MASTGIGVPRSRWRVWLGWAAVLAAGLLAVAWVTGAFAGESGGPGTCHAYTALADAGSADPVPCEGPHAGETAAVLTHTLNRAAVKKQCRSAAMEMLSAGSRQSHAVSAFREVLVDVQEPWRRSRLRCDVVRVAYTGVRSAWVPAVVEGSVAGRLAAEPHTWAQCRRLDGSREAASVACRKSSKRVVEFAFTVKTAGEYRPQKANQAVEKACRSAAKGEVGRAAEPVSLSVITKRDWESGSTTKGRCAFTTKVWEHSRP